MFVPNATASVASFADVTEALANSVVPTAPAAILAVVTASSAILAVVTFASVIFAVVTALLANLSAVTAELLIFAVFTALSSKPLVLILGALPSVPSCTCPLVWLNAVSRALNSLSKSSALIILPLAMLSAVSLRV